MAVGVGGRGGVPGDAVVAPGRALGAYGREHDLPVLYEPETETPRRPLLDRIGVIASGVLDLKATYHAPLDGGGRVLFGARPPVARRCPSPTPNRLFKIVRESGFVLRLGRRARRLGAR